MFIALGSIIIGLWGQTEKMHSPMAGRGQWLDETAGERMKIQHWKAHIIFTLRELI